MTTWSEVLDRYESALDQRARLLDLAVAEANLTTDAGPWPPPPALPAALPAGGVPAEHRARAEALLARTTELARQLSALRDSLPPLPGGRRPAARPATSAAPRRVDRAL